MDRPRADGSRLPRRRVVVAVVGLASVASAGCIEIGGGDGGPDAGDGGERTEADPALEVGDATLHPIHPLELVEPGDGSAGRTDLVSTLHWHHDPPEWHFYPLEIPLDGCRTVRALVRDAGNDPITLGEAFRVRARPSEDDRVAIDVRDDLIELCGLARGSVNLRFDLLQDGDAAWTSPPLSATVVG